MNIFVYYVYRSIGARMTQTSRCLMFAEACDVTWNCDVNTEAPTRLLSRNDMTSVLL